MESIQISINRRKEHSNMFIPSSNENELLLHTATQTSLIGTLLQGRCQNTHSRKRFIYKVQNQAKLIDGARNQDSGYLWGQGLLQYQVRFCLDLDRATQMTTLWKFSKPEHLCFVYCSECMFYFSKVYFKSCNVYIIQNLWTKTEIFSSGGRD